MCLVKVGLVRLCVKSNQLIVDKIAKMRVFPGLQLVNRAIQDDLIAQNLSSLLVDLFDHVTDGNTQFLPLATCYWLHSCRAI